MISVNLADFGHSPFVQRLQVPVQLVLVLEEMRDRLVDKLVSENDRFVTVAGRDIFPNVAEQLLRRFALEKPGVAVAVIDIVARLATGSVVHVEYQIQIVVAAPFHHTVHTRKAVLI